MTEFLESSANCRNKKLSARQARAIAVLLAGASQDSAAKAAGVTPRTIYDWLRRPEFRGELDRAAGELIEGAMRRLAGMSDKALTQLEAVLDGKLGHKQIPPGTKVRASKVVLDALLRLREFTVLEREIDSIKDEWDGD